MSEARTNYSTTEEEDTFLQHHNVVADAIYAAYGNGVQSTNAFVALAAMLGQANRWGEAKAKHEQESS
jgi:hypothetical protein